MVAHLGKMKSSVSFHYGHHERIKTTKYYKLYNTYFIREEIMGINSEMMMLVWRP